MSARREGSGIGTERLHPRLGAGAPPCHATTLNGHGDTAFLRSGQRAASAYRPRPAELSRRSTAAARRSRTHPSPGWRRARPRSAPTNYCGSKIRRATRSPSRATARRDSLRGGGGCAAGRAWAALASDRAVHHEDLGGGVGVDVVGAHERHHGPIGQPLDRIDQAGSRGLLKGPGASAVPPCACRPGRASSRRGSCCRARARRFAFLGGLAG